MRGYINHKIVAVGFIIVPATFKLGGETEPSKRRLVRRLWVVDIGYWGCYCSTGGGRFADFVPRRHFSCWSAIAMSSLDFSAGRGQHTSSRHRHPSFPSFLCLLVALFCPVACDRDRSGRISSPLIEAGPTPPATVFYFILFGNRQSKKSMSCILRLKKKKESRVIVQSIQHRQTEPSRAGMYACAISVET
jgi:hypothetical protein